MGTVVKSDHVVTLELYEGYEGVEITKVSDSKERETVKVARLGRKEGGEVDLKSVFKTINLSQYPNLKRIFLNSRFAGDYKGKPGKAWLGGIQVHYEAEGIRTDFENVFGKLRKTKPRAKRSKSTSCPKSRRPPCTGDWKHERKNNKGDDCCYKRPGKGSKKAKPESTLTIQLKDQALYANVRYPMKNHDLYLLVQRTIREHLPSQGGTVAIRGVKDNKSWAKHHKVVHVDPTYNVTLRKLRGKPVTIQLSQGNVSGADILKAVRKAYRGKNYSITREDGLYIVAEANYRVSSLGSLKIVKKEKSRRTKAISKLQTKWRKDSSAFKKEMIREGVGKKTCSSITHPSNCMTRSDCVYDSDHCRNRKSKREMHKISKLRAHQLAKEKRERIDKRRLAALSFARGQRPRVFPRRRGGAMGGGVVHPLKSKSRSQSPSKSKSRPRQKPRMSLRTVASIKQRFAAMLNRARGRIASKKEESERRQREAAEALKKQRAERQAILQKRIKADREKSERERKERHARERALMRRGKAARFIQQRWRDRKAERKNKEYWKKIVAGRKRFEAKHAKSSVTSTSSSPSGKKSLRILPHRYEGKIRPYIAKLGTRRVSTGSTSPIEYKRVEVKHRPVREQYRTDCKCAGDSPCKDGICYIDDTAIQTCKDEKVKVYPGIPREQQYDPTKADERAYVKCNPDGTGRKIRRGPAKPKERKVAIRRSSGVAARLAALRRAQGRDPSS